MKLQKAKEKFIDARHYYKVALMKAIKKELAKMPEDTLKLYDPDSEVGLGGFTYTDVLPKINRKGFGDMFNNIDCIDLAFNKPVSIWNECNIEQFEKIYEQLLR